MVAPWWNTCVPFTEVMDALWLVKLDPSQYLRRLSGVRSGHETAGEAAIMRAASRRLST